MANRTPHPFDPLTPEEISQAANVVKSHFPPTTLINFRVITLKEPPKHLMKDYLAKERGNQTQGLTLARTARVEAIVVVSQGTTNLIELHIDITKQEITRKEHLQGKHSYIDAAYMQSVESACLASPVVQSEIQKSKLPPNTTVVVEPWAYATDGQNDMSQRLTMCYFYLRVHDHPDANYYAYPLDLCAEVSEELEVAKVYRVPTKKGEKVHGEPRDFDKTTLKAKEDSEYHPELRPPPRSTTKPLRVIQPEGPSFLVEGNRITWEGWELRVGFNYREGLTLHDIRFGGRSLFYRLSLSEMFVPYADPRAPYPRKGAFDLGNDGAGVNANNLRLGCDCLGTIKYFSFYHNDAEGRPVEMRNVVCLHEQDDGILWKHTNFRTGNAVVARARVLILQTVITVSNYEYVFAFRFGMDAGIEYEVRATGILSTVPMAEDGENVEFGTRVAPGVLAPFHQHLFCFRIDPAIDGERNSVLVEESVPMAFGDEDEQKENLFGVGYTTTKKYIEKEGGLDLDFTKHRTFKIVNEGRMNPITRTPVGFKLMPHYSQMLLANENSFHAKRSEFGKHAVWLTKYVEDELYPSGKHTMQSMGGGGIDSVIKTRSASDQPPSVRNEDVVVWHTFGSTHNPRIEDWPVMPSEKMTIGLKPVNFFTGNPGLDVAPSTQEVNKSVLYEDCCSEGVA